MALLPLPALSREVDDRNWVPFLVAGLFTGKSPQLHGWEGKAFLSSKHFFLWMIGFVSTGRNFEEYPVQPLHFKNQKSWGLERLSNLPQGYPIRAGQGAECGEGAPFWIWVCGSSHHDLLPPITVMIIKGQCKRTSRNKYLWVPQAYWCVFTTKMWVKILTLQLISYCLMV